MKKKQSMIIIFIAIILSILATYFDGLIFRDLGLSNYKYLIEYNDGSIPGSSYNIYIFQNYEITVERRQYCSTPECINSDKPYNSDSYKVKFSYRNNQKLKNYLKELFKGKNNQIVLQYYMVNDNDKNVINAIIFNDETFFEYYKTKETPIEG